jgi:hypothetical protein
VRLASDTERQAAADYRREIAEHDENGQADLSPKGRAWVIAYDELAAARDALEYDAGTDER